MCGRYTLTVEKDELSQRFGILNVVPDYRPRYNAAPSQYMPVIVPSTGGKSLVMMKWGLVPFWAKEASIGNRMINARLETLAEKPSFRRSLSQRRCLVPADGYYEWQKLERGKKAMRIVAEHQELFAFAGLWDEWKDPEGTVLQSFTIITTSPVAAIASIHDRMPLILQADQEDYWLGGWTDADQSGAGTFLNRLRPLQALHAYEVSNLVNSPQHDDQELIEPLSSQGSLFE